MEKNIVSLINIKSKFILKRIFGIIKENKILKIMKYNKKLQNMLNKCLNDYKEFLSIEIEITPVEYETGIFINLLGDKNYYKIYFINNKKEMELKDKNSLNVTDDCSKIRVMIDYKIKSLERLFKNCSVIKKINFIKNNIFV